MIRMHWLAALALVIASPALAQAQQPTAETAARDAKVGEAIAAIKSGRAKDAIAILDPLLAEYQKLYAGEKRKIFCASDPTEALLYMGQAAVAKQDAIAIDNGWCIALWARGFAMIDLEQVDAAVPFLERAVALAPMYPHYLSELGYAYQAQKKWQLSYDTYGRAAVAAERQSGEQRKKSLRRAWYGMAYDLVELGRLEDAEKLFVQCLELTPNDQKVKDELQYVRDERAKKAKTKS